MACSLLSISALSQNAQQRQKITAKYDQTASAKLIQRFNQEYQKQEILNRSFIAQNPQYQHLLGDIRFIWDGKPIYTVPTNYGAAQSLQSLSMLPGGSLGLNLQGEDMTAGVWEAASGLAMTDHLDLSGRVIVFDSSGETTFHATHVAGTIASSGQRSSNNSGRGIAPAATILTATSQNDYAEMAEAASFGLLVSNHSYGYDASNLPVWIYGAYNADARSTDLLCNQYTYLLPVISAGNDRANAQNLNPDYYGYQLVTGMGVAKNALTVGAVGNVANYTGPNDVVMAAFSNWGPTDDGRIKPDLVSKGVGVYSTSNASTNAYAHAGGTSMASPGISGAIILLQQYYESLFGEFMLSATMRGLLMHTAREAGEAHGPDYQFGYGLPNVERAATTIQRSLSNTNAHIQENTLLSQQAQTFTVVASGNEPLMVSITWNDPAAVANNGQLNPTTLNLRNDLDVKVTRESSTHYPWSLNPEDPTEYAFRWTTNDVDNFERVEVDNAVANGTYTIHVTNKGSLVGASQDYSLIITGGTLQNLSTQDPGLQEVEISTYPNPARDIVQIKVPQNIQIHKFELLDAKGSMAMEIDIKSGIEFNQFNVSSLPVGLYYARFYTNEGIVYRKILKK